MTNKTTIEEAIKDMNDKIEAGNKEQREKVGSIEDRQVSELPSISVFTRLSEVNVSKQVQQKGKFSYLSWSNAVRELLKRFPSATWTEREWNDQPYLKTDTGCFVGASVTVNGIERSIKLPVLDFKNQPVKNPDAMQVNKAQMRCLTKCIALHGLGLDLWAGEDLQENENRVANTLISAKQYQELLRAVSDAEMDPVKVANKYGVNSLDDLNNDSFNNAMAILNKKIEKAKNENN